MLHLLLGRRLGVVVLWLWLWLLLAPICWVSRLCFHRLRRRHVHRAWRWRVRSAEILIPVVQLQFVLRLHARAGGAEADVGEAHNAIGHVIKLWEADCEDLADARELLQRDHRADNAVVT